jgi:hypothetical protein
MAFVVATRKLARLPHWVKVSDVFKTDQDAPFLKRAGITDLDDPRFTKYSQRLAHVRAIRNYIYRMDVLERSMLYKDVTEIFVRVNSLGAKLRSSDLALAQITAKWRGALKEFQGFQGKCASLGFDLDLAIHLRALVAFATNQSRFHTIGNLSQEKLQDAWERAKGGMEFAINFLKANAGMDSPAVLSSPYLVVALAYYGSQRGYAIPADEADHLRFWARIANAKGRYTRGSSETILDQDLATLRDGGGVEMLVDRLRLQAGRLDITADELQGRNQRSALFKTMFLAFRDDRARDWSSNLEISLDHTGTQHKLQFHHIFPKAPLTKKFHRTSREADDIANLAFISGGTNRRVLDKLPAVYLATIAEEDRRQFHRTQCVPDETELLEPENYNGFLARRRELIAERLTEYLETTGHLEPDRPRDSRLRLLDERVETIELQLRKLAGDQVGDIDELPQHVVANLKARRQADERRNPGAANRHADGFLAYCDLRELQDILMAKDLWPRWSSIFGTKEQLQTRFEQLAALRNAVRHSRTVDDVTMKDGEAALLWFAGVLSKSSSR